MKKTHVFKILLVVMLLVSLMGFASAEPEKILDADGDTDWVATSINSLKNVFTSLFSGELGDALGHLLDAIPFFAVFLAIYGLFWWLGSVTLFKDQSHQKFAHMFAIGLSLASVWQGSIFSFIMDLIAGTFLPIVMLILVVFMLIILLRRARTNSFREGANMYAAQGDALHGKADVKATKRDMAAMDLDLKGDAKHAFRSMADIRNSWKNRHNSEHDEKVGEKIIGKLESMEAKEEADTAKLSNIENSMEQAAKHLADLADRPAGGDNSDVVNAINELSHKLKEGEGEIGALHAEIAKSMALLNKLLASDKDEAKRLHADLVAKMDEMKTSTDAHIQQLAKEISGQLQTIANQLKQAENIEVEIEHDEGAEEHDVELIKQDFGSIHRELGEIMAELKAGTLDKAKAENLYHRMINLKQQIADMRNHEAHVKQLEAQLVPLRKQIMGELKRIDGESAVEVKEENHEGGALKQIENLEHKFRVKLGLLQNSPGNKTLIFGLEKTLAEIHKIINTLSGTEKSKLLEDWQKLSRDLQEAKK